MADNAERAAGQTVRGRAWEDLSTAQQVTTGLRFVFETVVLFPTELNPLFVGWF